MTRPFRLAAPRVLESDLQAQIIDYLRVEQARGRIGWFCRVNGGAVKAGADYVKFYKLHVPGHAGRSKGKADIEGLLGNCSEYPGRYFALEVKRPGGKPTKEQLEFLDATRAVGGIAAVVRSFEDAKSVLFGEMDPARDQTAYGDRKSAGL